MLPKIIVNLFILALAMALISGCQSEETTPAIPTVPPLLPTVPLPPPTVPPPPSPTAQTFANTPEGVVSKILYSIQTQDANGYLDALDPELRQEPNYFMGSTFSKGLLAAFGLGSSIDLSKISFRDVAVEVLKNDGEIAYVLARGKIRNLAFATEEDFEGFFVARKIQDTWFVSDEATANAKAIQAAAQATAQAVETLCREVPSKIKFERQGPIKYDYGQMAGGGDTTASAEFEIRVTNDDDKARTIIADWYLFLHLPFGDGGYMRGSFERDFAPHQSQTIKLGSDSGYGGGRSSSDDLTFMLRQVDDVTYDYAAPKIGKPIQSPVTCNIAGTQIPLKFVRRPTRLFEIKMVSPTEGWALTTDEWILHYIDGFWREEYLPIRSYDRLTGLHMLSPEEGWAVGDDGLVLHYVNGTWENVETRAERGAMLRDVFMFSPNDGWVAGYYTGMGYPLLMQYTDGYWLRAPLPAVNTPGYFEDINEIFMVSPDEAWAATGSQYSNDLSLLHLTNGEWLKVNNPSNQPLHSIYAISPDDIWAVGANGAIVHYDGNAWSASNRPTDSHLTSVHMVSDTEGWAVGNNRTILHFHNGSWEKLEAPTTDDLYSVYMVSPNEGWAVGGNSILHYEDGVWSDGEE